MPYVSERIAFPAAFDGVPVTGDYDICWFVPCRTGSVVFQAVRNDPGARGHLRVFTNTWRMAYLTTDPFPVVCTVGEDMVMQYIGRSPDRQTGFDLTVHETASREERTPILACDSLNGSAPVMTCTPSHAACWRLPQLMIVLQLSFAGSKLLEGDRLYVSDVSGNLVAELSSTLHLNVPATRFPSGEAIINFRPRANTTHLSRTLRMERFKDPAKSVYAPRRTLGDATPCIAIEGAGHMLTYDGRSRACWQISCTGNIALRVSRADITPDDVLLLVSGGSSVLLQNRNPTESITCVEGEFSIFYEPKESVAGAARPISISWVHHSSLQWCPLTSDTVTHLSVFAEGVQVEGRTDIFKPTLLRPPNFLNGAAPPPTGPSEGTRVWCVPCTSKKPYVSFEVPDLAFSVSLVYFTVGERLVHANVGRRGAFRCREFFEVILRVPANAAARFKLTWEMFETAAEVNLTETTPPTTEAPHVIEPTLVPIRERRLTQTTSPSNSSDPSSQSFSTLLQSSQGVVFAVVMGVTSIVVASISALFVLRCVESKGVKCCPKSRREEDAELGVCVDAQPVVEGQEVATELPTEEIDLSSIPSGTLSDGEV